ncbi:serine/threonine protein kinase [Lacipirellula parvula]|uniref:Protein kinase domain-containing protein n=1 Tax=Lacipirellula parvula TaxID=2650471 RepID=A0A5K7XMK9_9BACT|nr:serine/threonine-protein kinase [Lacipirellula parvula]BBO36076.1 hypothetical protein PLANPX_5688 [Lacipirellula parvula]
MSFIIVRIDPSGTTKKLSFAYGLELEGSTGHRFKLGKHIRTGGNGVVFEAECTAPDGTEEGLCAVKFLKELDDVRQDRFANEIRILNDLSHPNIVKCFGSGRVRLGEENIDVPWMAMSLGDVNLRQYLDEHKAPLDAITAINTCIKVCNAIAHLHDKSIIHRDLKPANVIWLTDEDRDNIFLVDFGIAKYVGEDVSARRMDDFTSLHQFVGPANFASPELLAYSRDKSHPVDTRSDLFQIGLLLWFLATNRIAAGIPSRRLDPTNGPIFEIATQLLAMDPDDRIPTAGDLSKRLSEIVATL